MSGLQLDGLIGVAWLCARHCSVPRTTLIPQHLTLLRAAPPSLGPRPTITQAPTWSLPPSYQS